MSETYIGGLVDVEFRFIERWRRQFAGAPQMGYPDLCERILQYRKRYDRWTPWEDVTFVLNATPEAFAGSSEHKP